MKLYRDEIIEKIALHCRLTSNLEGFKLIYYVLELDDSDGINMSDINKLLTLHKFPNWDTIKQINIKDI